MTNYQRDVYIVDGARSPFLKVRSRLGPFKASDLAVGTARVLLARQSFAPTDIQQVICGAAMPDADEANIARVIALRLGCGNHVPAFTVQRNCASGMQAIDNAALEIASGRADLILAGGTDSMSRAPLLYDVAMANWLMQFMGSKSVATKGRLLLQFRPHFLVPIIAILRGLTDPIVGLSMGQTAENLAYRFNITRQDMDSYALRSHQRSVVGLAAGHLNEITPLIDAKGHVYDHDDGVRPESSIEKLARLRPFFDKKFGMVTAGNSSQITDGASFLVLASADAVKKHKLPVLAKITDAAWSALDPAEMGLGPAYASTELLKRHKLKLDDIDFWEINEAFAAQVIACKRALADEKFCREQLGLDAVLGDIDEDRLNVDGGAIACGHPIGASGARITLHLAEVLKRENAKRGIASLCVGGGQGGALLLETV
jgi:acetyl-CoA C-acetyltransferase